MAVKASARVITVAWGEEYIRRILSITLPALLARGNLPALAEHFSCTFILVTEECWFDRIRSSAVWHRLGGICEPRLLPVDDLVAARNHYGVSLTFAFLRGFEELGSRMTETYLLFLNADFVLADGSYRSLAARMLAGERLIHAPSYCVIAEEVGTKLRAHLNQKECTLALSPREMATLCLAHRHYTVRGKTVNQRLIRMHRFEQLYWQVDDHTLLGRQLPISLVCMKPERALTELETFWDFGVVSEFCPTTKPCILGDSDDFLMLELRSANTFRDLLRLGWASPSEIAADLSSYTTKDHRDSGRLLLILHDRDLPSTLGDASAQFNGFVNDIYREMSPEPVSHLNHPFWTSSYPAFKRAQMEFLESEADLRSASAPGPVSIEEASADAIPDSVSTLVKPEGFIEKVYAILFGRIPLLKRTHPYLSALRPAFDLLTPEFAKSSRNVLLISETEGPLCKFVRSYSRRGHSIIDGSVYLCFDSISKAKDKKGRGARVWKSICRPLPHPVRSHDESRTKTVPYTDDKELFDLCVCELKLNALLRFEKVFRRIRPLMRPGGLIVVFLLNQPVCRLQRHQNEIIQQVALPFGQSSIRFTGSVWTKWALRLYDLAAVLNHRYPRWGSIARPGLVLCALPLSVIGNWLSDRQPGHVMPKTCVSMTVEYRLF